eukprot:3245743-Amphidinium_carterae.1
MPLCTTQLSADLALLHRNSQPRRALPPLVPEFAYMFQHPVSAALPPMHRVLPSERQGVINTDGLTCVGVCRSPEEYMKEALSAKHPMDGKGAIPDDLLMA